MDEFGQQIPLQSSTCSFFSRVADLGPTVPVGPHSPGWLAPVSMTAAWSIELSATDERLKQENG